MKKTDRKHIARPMDAYKKKTILKCVDNPETAFRCEAVRNTESYRSVKEIIAEFDPAVHLEINSNEPAF